MGDDLTLVLTDYPDADSKGPPYSGARQVSQDLFKSILQYSNVQRIILVGTRRRLREMEDRIAQYPSRCPVALMTVSGFISCDIGSRAIFQQLRASLPKAIYLRSQRQGCSYPVFGISHDVSDISVFHDLLLARAAGATAPDSLICCSEACRTAVVHILAHVDSLLGYDVSNEQIHLPVVAHGIDIDAYTQYARDIARKRIGLDNESFIFLYVGRISLSTKADLIGLVRAFAAEFWNDRAELVLAGGTRGAFGTHDVIELRQTAYAEGIFKRVRILENPNNIQRNFLYSAADVFVSPANSLQESFGVALLEAMTFGLPVVASDWNGYREIVVNGQTGYLTPTSFSHEIGEAAREYWLEDHTTRLLETSKAVSIDIKSLRTSMRHLFNTPQEAAAMGKEGKKRARAKFDWKRIILKYEEQWEKSLRISTSEHRSLPRATPFYDLVRAFVAHPGTSWPHPKP